MMHTVFTVFLLLLLGILGLFLWRNMRRQYRLLPLFPHLPSALPLSWYRQRRMLVSLSMILVALLALFLQSGLLNADTILHLSSSLDQVVMRSGAISSTLELAAHTDPQPAQMAALAIHTDPQSSVGTQSPGMAGLLRVDSAARDQYASVYEWQTWSYSSCSGIALETVMNSYGRHLIASDVLQVEQDLGVWNVQLGLLRDDGIAQTAAYFGFTTSSSHSLTVAQVIAIANQGSPVIVSVRDYLHFPGGHVFVVRGGDAQSVFVVDSSLFNLQSLPRAQFSAMWEGFSAVLTPRT